MAMEMNTDCGLLPDVQNSTVNLYLLKGKSVFHDVCGWPIGTMLSRYIMTLINALYICKIRPFYVLNVSIGSLDCQEIHL
jgi:Na+-driven multidrug efflux pump